MKLELKFNKTDWLTIFRDIILEETDTENVEKGLFKDFIIKLKASEDTETFLYPPETKNGLIARTIMGVVEKPKNKDIYYNLLKANNQPNYQQLVWRASDNNRRDNVVISLNESKNEYELFFIMQHAIMLSPPNEVQSAFEYFKDCMSELDNIDSKSETKEKRNQILSEYHKAIRQTDMFGDGHTCMILYNLWSISNIVIRVMTAVIEHVKEAETK